MGRDFTDDSSAALGLAHSSRSATPLDGKGRPIVILPPSTAGYDPELVDKSPEEMAQILAQRSADALDRQANDIECLMHEAPGGRAGGSSHSGGGRRRRKKRSSGASYAHVMAATVDHEDPDLRPITISAKVSVHAHRGIYGAGNPSFGEMAELLGRTLCGTSWRAIEQALRAMPASA